MAIQIRVDKEKKTVSYVGEAVVAERKLMESDVTIQCNGCPPIMVKGLVAIKELHQIICVVCNEIEN